MTTLVTLFLEIEWNRLAQPYLALWLSHRWLWWLLSWAMYLGTRIIPFTKEKCVFSLKWRIIPALRQWLAASIAVRKWNAWRHVLVTVHATHSNSGQQIAVASYWRHQWCVCLTALQAVLHQWGSVGATKHLHGKLSHRLSESCNGWNHALLDLNGP